MNETGRNFSLMVHGGAGALDELGDAGLAGRYRDSIERVLGRGREMLVQGAPAIDAVEVCAALLEDDPLFNAGRGSVLNEAGRVEMDAAIMDGRNLDAGAVAGVHGIANPVRLARRLLDTPLVLLVGDGALAFAAQCGIARVDDDYFLLPERVAQLRVARSRGEVTLDHVADAPPDKLGTIGAVARDRDGNLAAATSTGGMVNKHVGRVGDSPLVGAGVYADNASCAYSATGYGEDFIRTVLGRTIAGYIELQGMDALAAVDAGIAYLRRRVNGRGGVIVIDHAGNCSAGFTTPNMIHGWIERGGESVVRL